LRAGFRFVGAGDARFCVILLRATDAALFAFLAAVFNVDFGFSSLPRRRPRLHRQWQF